MPDPDPVWGLIAANHHGALVTIKRDGRPQLSTIGYVFDSTARRATISVTDSRAKTRNIRRDPRVSLYVSAPDFRGYAVAEGVAEVGPVASRPDDAAAEALVAYYRAISGEHPDWEDYRRAMVAEGRLVLTVTFDRAYGWAG